MNVQNLAAVRSRFHPVIAIGLCVRSFSASTSGNSTNIQDVGHRLLECYRVLDLPQTCTKEELKSRYLDLAKRYHPDTGGSTANVESFRQVHNAYKFIVDNDYNASDRQELESVPKIFDIRHTAPQHRQYLEYGGVGHGTPSQRMRQYQQHRVAKPAENVNEYMVNKLMANQTDYSLITKTVEEREYARKWKTRSAVDRLVEDLIQESMRRGEFQNLSGAGKPLAYDSHNPYVDSMTHKLNQVLIQNGFCPEWVLMEKEIRTEMKRIKEALVEARKKVDDDPFYLSRPGERERMWNETVARLRDDSSALNKRIDSFNLVVPSLHKQMVHFSLDKELNKLSAAMHDAASGGTKAEVEINGSTKSASAKEGKWDQQADLRVGAANLSEVAGVQRQNQEKSMGVFRMLFYALTHNKAH